MVEWERSRVSTTRNRTEFEELVEFKVGLENLELKIVIHPFVSAALALKRAQQTQSFEKTKPGLKIRRRLFV